MNVLIDDDQCALVLTANYRALIHGSSLLVLVLVETISTRLTIAILSLMVVVYVTEEYLRLKGRHLPFFYTFTMKMSRKNERDHFISPPVFLAVGIIIVLLIFPRNIACASIAIVAIGDPVAAYVGSTVGRSRIGRKSLEGFAMGTLAAFAPTLLLVPPSIGAIGSIAGMILELTGVLDDNLMIPVSSGAAMYLATILLVHAVA